MHKGKELKASEFYLREENKYKRMKTAERVGGDEDTPTGI